MKKKIRIAIYSRKSKYTEKGDSIGNQIELAKEYIKAHYPSDQYEVEIKEYEDEGFSGGNIDRPQFRNFLKEQRENPYNVLICYRLDRISRNIANFSNLMEELTSVNTSFVSIKEQFDTKTPMGRAMMYIASVFAQLEREVIAERIRDNMLELAKTGRWLGGDTPTGFKSERYELIQVCETAENSDNILETKAKKACKLVTDNEEKDLIIFLYNKYLELKSLSQLEYYCLVNNVKTKREKNFSKFTLRTILSNPVYVKNDLEVLKFFNEKGINIYAEQDGRDKFDGKYGLLAYNKRKNSKLKKNFEDWIVAVGLHEGFIEGQKWVQVQRTMEANRQDNHYKSAAFSKNNVVFSGLLRCGSCHNKMKVSTSGKDYQNGDKRYYYICETKTKSKGLFCKGNNISGRELDNNIVNILKTVFVPNSEVYKELKNMTISKKEINQNHEIHTLRTKIDKNNVEISNLVEKMKYIDIEIIDVVNTEIKKLKKENETIEQKIDILEKEGKNNNNEANTAKFILNIINNCFDKYNELTLKDKKDILNMFVESAYVINRHSIELNFLNTRLEETLKKWYYNNSLNKQNSLNNKENRSTEIEKATVEICSKSEEISNIFKKVKDKGILTEPLKYDTEKRTFVSEFPEKEKEFADFVKEYREANKMSKKDLSELIGVDTETYTKYENKRLKFQNQNMVNKIIKILGMNTEEVKVPEYIKFLNSNPNEKMKQYMQENDLNIKQFSKIIKVNENTVANWINKGTQISIQTFNKLKNMKKNLENKKHKHKSRESELEP